jgi:type VI secretion system protein VasJ
MRAQVRNRQPWLWFATGKHPAAADYFRIGAELPLMRALAQWIAGGYRQIDAENQASGGHCSWRFWLGVPKTNWVVSGLVRDSSDRLGRMFPFAIMATGELRDWPTHWDQLPEVLEATWVRIEYLAARSLSSVRQLEEEIGHLPGPAGEWTEERPVGLADHGLDPPEGCSDWAQAAAAAIESLTAQGRFITELPAAPGADPMRTALFWNLALKAQWRETPQAIFLGGAPQRAYMAVFNRSLNSSDFIELWSRGR